MLQNMLQLTYIIICKDIYFVYKCINVIAAILFFSIDSVNPVRYVGQLLRCVSNHEPTISDTFLFHQGNGG
jgi:hypothetical protein